jgi:hypothetical protein
MYIYIYVFMYMDINIYIYISMHVYTRTFVRVELGGERDVERHGRPGGQVRGGVQPHPLSLCQRFPLEKGSYLNRIDFCITRR